MKYHERGEYPATNPAFSYLVQQEDLIYPTLQPFELIELIEVRLSIQFIVKKTCSKWRKVKIAFLTVICCHISISGQSFAIVTKRFVLTQHTVMIFIGYCFDKLDPPPPTMNIHLPTTSYTLQPRIQHGDTLCSEAAFWLSRKPVTIFMIGFQ